jgi:FkbM family methyltransferase
LSVQLIPKAIRKYGRPLKPYLRIASSAFFSQYGEDALLFLTMKPSRSGFYVDVGAYAPVDGSNTYKLYMQGWRGLTIEPNPKVQGPFRTVRGGDTHLTMGVSKTPDTLQYFEFEIPMLNTLSEERANLLRSEGYVFKNTRKIECAPLCDILDRHAAGKHMDLLSVDCEGFDLDVLQTIDFVRQRPTAVLVEDLEGFGNFREDAGHSEIERFMREHNYAPIAQAIYSTLYVARDWRALNQKTSAYTERMIQPGLLP